jgi:hypothetical protein
MASTVENIYLYIELRNVKAARVYARSGWGRTQIGGTGSSRLRFHSLITSVHRKTTVPHLSPWCGRCQRLAGRQHLSIHQSIQEIRLAFLLRCKDRRMPVAPSVELFSLREFIYQHPGLAASLICPNPVAADLLLATRVRWLFVHQPDRQRGLLSSQVDSVPKARTVFHGAPTNYLTHLPIYMHLTDTADIPGVNYFLLRPSTKSLRERLLSCGPLVHLPAHGTCPTWMDSARDTTTSRG